MGDQPAARPLPTHDNTNIHASSVIRTHYPSFERAEMCHALDRVATVIGFIIILFSDFGDMKVMRITKLRK
jgi:hypothetical protein